jgi:hypothetical protein
VTRRVLAEAHDPEGRRLPHRAILLLVVVLILTFLLLLASQPSPSSSRPAPSLRPRPSLARGSSAAVEPHHHPTVHCRPLRNFYSWNSWRRSSSPNPNSNPNLNNGTLIPLPTLIHYLTWWHRRLTLPPAPSPPPSAALPSSPAPLPANPRWTPESMSPTSLRPLSVHALVLWRERFIDLFNISLNVLFILIPPEFFSHDSSSVRGYIKMRSTENPPRHPHRSKFAVFE